MNLGTIFKEYRKYIGRTKHGLQTKIYWTDMACGSYLKLSSDS